MVVEIVGDSSGEHAQALEFLCVLNLGLETPPLGFGVLPLRDVAYRGRQKPRAAVLEPRQQDRGREIGPVRPAMCPFEEVRAILQRQTHHLLGFVCRPGAVRLVLRGKRRRRMGREILLVLAGEQLDGGRVRGQKPPFRRRRHHGVSRVKIQRPVPFFAFLQQRLHLSALLDLRLKPQIGRGQLRRSLGDPPFKFLFDLFALRDVYLYAVPNQLAVGQIARGGGILKPA